MNWDVLDPSDKPYDGRSTYFQNVLLDNNSDLGQLSTNNNDNVVINDPLFQTFTIIGPCMKFES